MTDQPVELDRILKFTIVCLMISLSSESMAYAVSSQLNVTVSPRYLKYILLLPGVVVSCFEKRGE